MRSAYVAGLKLGDKEILLGKEYVHHFKNVLRIKIGREILLLNGQGVIAGSTIKGIDNKTIDIEINESKMVEKNKIEYSVAFSLVKKDALESCLRSCVELGVSEIFILESDFSQKYEINDDRVEKILINACEQSNNPYIPKVTKTSINSVPYEGFNNIFFGDMSNSQKINKQKSEKNLILIGSEGGFSVNEIEKIKLIEGIICVNLGSSILRARTALPAIIGYAKSLENVDA